MREQLIVSILPNSKKLDTHKTLPLLAVELQLLCLSLSSVQGHTTKILIISFHKK